MGSYRLLRPLLFRLPPESAHNLVLRGLAALTALPGGTALARAGARPGDAALAVSLWGRTFPNPVGIAAGLDKDGIAAAPLPADRALINRMGFNNAGAAALAQRLARLRRAWPGALLGVNVGKNADTPLERAPDDYVAALDAVYAVADYLAINVSSPNTPGLRGLQQREALRATLAAATALRARHVHQGQPRVPILVKVAPELDEAALADVVTVVEATGCDGLIATNTTLSRGSLHSPLREQSGGLSGAPLRPLAVRTVGALHRLSGGRLPIVGVGGIASAEDAYALVRAGASLVQLYTALIYEGPGLIRRIRHGLAALLARDGFASVAAAVGTASAQPQR